MLPLLLIYYITVAFMHVLQCEMFHWQPTRELWPLYMYYSMKCFIVTTYQRIVAFVHVLQCEMFHCDNLPEKIPKVN